MSMDNVRRIALSQNSLVRIVFLCALIFLTSCSSTPLPEHTEFTHHIGRDTASYLQKTTTELRADGIEGNDSGFFILANPIDALVARAALIRKAEHTIDVQYYIYKSDLTGKILVKEMLDAADRGVRVRILLDDFGSFGNDKGLIALNAHPNVYIRLFNPFKRSGSMSLQLLTGFGKKTRRMHNKALIADNQLSIVGGRNIGDEYFGANPSVVFDDLDVLLTNPVTNDISQVFDEFWNSSKSRPVSEKIDMSFDDEQLIQLRVNLEEELAAHQNSEYSIAIRNSRLVNKETLSEFSFRWAGCKLKADSVEKIRAERDAESLMLAPQLASLLKSLSERFIVVSPYFVPGEKGVAFFKTLRDRNVEVIVVTNSLASNDVAIVHSGYSKYRRDLIELGVKIYEIDGRDFESRPSGSLSERFASRSSLHAKYFVFDDTATFIGSFNFDPRSFYENTEVGVSIYSSELSQALADEVLKQLPLEAFEVTLNDKGSLQWQLGDEIFDKEPGTSWFKRVLNVIMGWLPVESQL